MRLGDEGERDMGKQRRSSQAKGEKKHVGTWKRLFTTRALPEPTVFDLLWGPGRRSCRSVGRLAASESAEENAEHCFRHSWTYQFLLLWNADARQSEQQK